MLIKTKYDLQTTVYDLMSAIYDSQNMRLNIVMSKTQKELAFLHDLYVAPVWTERFTGILDENFKFASKKKILYVNAGTGNHAIELHRKLNKDAQFRTYGADTELNAIAQAKAGIVDANINFSSDLPHETFDAVLADASLIQSKNLPDFLEQVINLSSNQVAFFLPTAGSFGEIFSFLWETFFGLNILDNSVEIERLITDIPTVSKVEELATSFGLTTLETVTKTEFFEFENGTGFINSPLVESFLLPVWLEFLNEREKERVCQKLAQTIDADDGTLTFRFSIKATLVVGEKS